MSKEERKVPELRFKGFFEDWEQRKFNNIVDRISISSDDENLPRVEYEDIISGQGVLNKDVYSKNSEKQGIEFRPNDILFGKLRPYLNKWLNPKFKGIAVGDFWVLRTREIESKFVYYLIQTFKFKSISNISTGTKMPRSDWSIVSNSNFFVPQEYHESEKISEFISYLENSMALHQRKIQALQKTKVLYLQKMLANKEQKRPHLRFKTFQDSWQNYKLKNIISTEFKGKATARMSGSQSLYLDTNYLNGGEALFVDCATNIDKDDVIILWDGSQAGKVYHGFVGALGSTLKAFRPLYSGAFIYYQLLKNQERIYNNYRTPNIPHVIKSFSEEFLIPMGSQKEQNSISDFFNTLDHDIKYYKEKVNILVKLKVIYLKKMFI